MMNISCEVFYMRHAGGKLFIVMNADLGGKGKADFYLFLSLGK